MDPRNKNTEQRNANETQEKENENVAQAHQQAEDDMQKDADLSIHSPNDDLDEGETARLGENTDLV